MEINNFQGELIDITAKNEAVVGSTQIRLLCGVIVLRGPCYGEM